MGRYDEFYDRSIRDPEGFWREAARAIAWERVPERILDASDGPIARWFSDGQLNTCHNALDRHVDEGRGEQVALIYDSPVTETIRRFTYHELRDEVAVFAGALAGLGVERGDRVVIYMPMVPRALVAMLACARLGAVHSVVFGGFAAHELALRIDDAQPKALVTATCGIEVSRVIDYTSIVDAALDEARFTPEHRVLLQRPERPGELRAGAHDWDELVAGAEAVAPVPVDATDPLYILYTSGTTGGPKGVVRDNGGHAVALRLSMDVIYDLAPGQVFWTASDVGWVVGHSYIVYAPLFTGATTVLYEGKPVGTPDPGAFWRVVAEHGVEVLFSAPTALRAIKREDPEGRFLEGHDLSSLRTLFQAGERLDPETYAWASELLGIPVVDHWWQTETGWAIAGNPMGVEALPPKPGSATKPAPGYRVAVLDEGGRPVAAGQEGTVALELPLPPGTLTGLWGDPERTRQAYFDAFPGYYSTGDGGYLGPDGYLFVMGRTDDVINVAGHRLSTGTMEEVVAAHPAVAECAVIGVADELKGQVPWGFAVLKAGSEIGPDELREELIQAMRARVGAVASFRQLTVVERLPKTRSGKVLRSAMRGVADGRRFTTPATIEDPAALDEIREALEAARRTTV